MIMMTVPLFFDGRRDRAVVAYSDFCDDDEHICLQEPHHPHLLVHDDGCCCYIDHGKVLVEAFFTTETSVAFRSNSMVYRVKQSLVACKGLGMCLITENSSNYSFIVVHEVCCMLHVICSPVPGPSLAPSLPQKIMS